MLGARASHPPPSDLSHYFIRSFAHGRDNMLEWSGAGNSLGKKLVKVFQWSAQRIRYLARRLRRSWRKVDLHLWQIPLAFSIMFFFYILPIFSSFATLLFPHYAKKHWRI